VAVLLWDASALTKRYYVESGSDTVDALYTAASGARMVTTFWGYAETHASLWRKRNRGDISAAAFRSAVTLLRAEVLLGPTWELLTIDDGAVLAGIDFVERYNVNTTDAALLATYLRYAQAQAPGAGTSVLIAADKRLLRAAGAEGLATLDPEAIAAADVPALLATW
jgi:predicted nucleic acid-binding protein